MYIERTTLHPERERERKRRERERFLHIFLYLRFFFSKLAVSTNLWANVAFFKGKRFSVNFIASLPTTGIQPNALISPSDGATCLSKLRINQTTCRYHMGNHNHKNA